MNQPKLDKLEDLADLLYQHEAAMLFNLRHRFLSRYVYVTEKHQMIRIII